ncbi:HlyC/CorC family transporter [Cellulomonas sp. zg-ZUI222]|uniref:HlyC/CorC family transporter n=1 Tax=Cellulomonas wangleii TaxID=2816956 RepID=A0ABX8D5D7_9CELL|nr:MULTISPECIES: hemolysin family protein [Cellulomonas]MBO0902004.1 HlyC/CorC family transporter [Cellulomonas sp. zg-ZUI22]MBO0922860.1 HlyC/CorC family transporter [Cellulomonas wangleii]MBO0925232.1 HlyC/CorC family transporter [Cellulomonas wangleii]QVI61262.1 HlyC/CorC family transporter [Cellulomonas wangleii]
MSNPWVVVATTVAIIALSAFFVAVEFAMLAARRHRFEDAAATSRTARAALRSSHELTVLLAGAQLGITACTLALGAITKPAVHHWLTPLFATWGLPAVPADVVGFVLALIIVTFLHLVVGEMAPKSWAIAHPEASAQLLAIPMRAFMWAVRPVLRALNESANRMLRRVGVEPVDEMVAVTDPASLRHLVEHSANVGALDASFSAQLSQALELQRITVRDLADPGAVPVTVPTTATVQDVQRASLDSGHLRILVGDAGAVTGVVHVRDTLTSAPSDAAAPFVRPVYELPGDTLVATAFAGMREGRHHLAVLTGGERTLVVTLADVVERLLPQATGTSAA